MRAALEAKPNWILAINGMGRIHLAREEKAEALAYYERAYQIDPNWPFGVINLANIVNGFSKDFTRAEGLYREAIRLAPDRPTFRYSLATFFFNQGKTFHPQACEEYKACLNMPAAGGRALSPQAEQIARQRISKICGY